MILFIVKKINAVTMKMLFNQGFGAIKSKSVEGRSGLPGHPIPGDTGGCLSSTSIINDLFKGVK